MCALSPAPTHTLTHSALVKCVTSHLAPPGGGWGVALDQMSSRMYEVTR